MSAARKKPAAGGRVIVHLDLDCFYAQVEQRRLGIPSDQPVAVQQWGSLLAVNYVARTFGVQRSEHTSEALKKCPAIHLPHVDTLGENRRPNEAFDRTHQKAILRRYRLASREIFAVLSRLAPQCEKAGIDEAFLDLTQQAHERLGLTEVVASDFCSDAANQATKVFGISQMDGVGKDAELDALSGFPLTAQEQLLAAGAAIANEIREAIRTELQFTCSTGVATNKLLAKLASPLNKPDGQTVIAPRFVPLLMQHFPLRKVRGLGGKLGKQLEDLLALQEAPTGSAPREDIPVAATAPSEAVETGKDEAPKPKTTVAEFTDKFRFEELVKHLGYEGAVYVRQVCSGEDGNEPVNEKKTEVKAFSAVKQFDQRSGDALVRVDQLEYWVRVLSEEIILRCEDERVDSKRFPLQLLLNSTRPGGKPKPRKLRIAQTTTVDELYAATMAVLRRDLDSVFPCSSISMHAKDFMALDSTNVSSISSFFVKQQPQQSSESEGAGGEGGGSSEAASSSHPAEDTIKQFALEFDLKDVEDTFKVSEDAFAQFRAASSTASRSNKSKSDASARESFYCDRCLRSVMETRAEHADFHFAVDLSLAERSENRVQQASASAGRAGTSATAGKKRKTGPLDAFLKR